LQVATRASAFTFDPFGTPLTAPRSAGLIQLAYEMATITRPLVAGTRPIAATEQFELAVYGYFP
jgi:hypothetical protein